MRMPMRGRSNTIRTSCVIASIAKCTKNTEYAGQPSFRQTYETGSIIKSIEAGKANPSVATLLKIAEVLGLELRLKVKEVVK